MYVPQLKGLKEAIKGLPCFQHPARNSNEYLTPIVDYYSELVIYLSLMLIANHPELWTPDKIDNDDILLFNADDIQNINSKESILHPFRYEQTDSIFSLIATLQMYHRETSLDKLSPLEKILDKWIKGDPASPKQKETQKADIDVQAIIKGMNQ
jgi:hypothetical protein